MSELRAPKGTQDVLPPESGRWEEVISRFGSAAHRAGFGLVIDPLFEDVEVFRRGVGGASETVTREMYEFDDRAGRRLALRPEGTASVVRAFVQHRPPLPWKAYYVTPAFRYEQPQAGRYRQHHQLGVEALGTEDPALDVEVIALLAELYASLELRAVELRVNSMGDAACRPGYNAALSDYLAAHETLLCGEHRERWRANPLRVLDCKQDRCRSVRDAAPRISEAWCDPCREHRTAVVEGLKALGCDYVADDFLVRGLDYYRRTTFEFRSLALASAQDAIGGGGRYDGLVQSLGGPAIGGVGFAAGIERILLACDAEGVLPACSERVQVFVVDITAGAAVAPVLLRDLRRAGISADRAYDSRSLKAQLKLADRSGAQLALIVGDQEAEDGSVLLRRLRSRQDDDLDSQQVVAQSLVVAAVRRAVTPR